jgi:hypothetical protein
MPRWGASRGATTHRGQRLDPRCHPNSPSRIEDALASRPVRSLTHTPLWRANGGGTRAQTAPNACPTSAQHALALTPTAPISALPHNARRRVGRAGERLTQDLEIVPLERLCNPAVEAPGRQRISPYPVAVPMVFACQCLFAWALKKTAPGKAEPSSS